MFMRQVVRIGRSWTAVLAMATFAPASAPAQITMSIPTNLTAHPGDTIPIPVNLSISSTVLDSAHGNGIATVGFEINFNSSLGTVPGSSIALGSLISNPSYQFSAYGSNSNESAGQIRTFSTGTPGTPGLASGTAGAIATIMFSVPASAVPNAYALTLAPVDQSITVSFVTDNNINTYSSGQGLTLSSGLLTVTTVPEPGSLCLVGLVVSAAAAAVRRRRIA
jgi:hypothetical protein